MKEEQLFNVIKKYRDITGTVLVALLNDKIKEKDCDSKKVQALLAILEAPVSKCSVFSDQLWEFREQQERSAKTLANSRFAIDFSRYEYIPQSVMFEIKLVVLLVTMLPRSELYKGQKSNSKLKIQSVVPQFNSLLYYLDHVFMVMSERFGIDVVRDNFLSIGDLKTRHYEAYSEGFETTSDTANVIERTQRYFQSNRIVSYVFGTTPSVSVLSRTAAVVKKSKRDVREKILSDDTFEQASAISGYLVSDFLSKLDQDIADQKSMELMKNFPYELGRVETLGIDWVMLDNYTMIRLLSKGFPAEEAITRIKDPSNLLTNRHDSPHLFRKALQEHYDNKSIVGDIQLYLDAIYQASFYLIGQYTGMRPSELVETRLDEPLQDSFGVPCIVSRLRKHQESERALFDDLWVCIPAMVDAWRAAQIISITKNNPYLCSKAETIPYGEVPSHMSASGPKHTLKLYLNKILPTEHAQTDFFMYVLRHTLAYQLFKADLGLPYISHQLKHFGNLVGAFHGASNKGFSTDTLGYGEIGEKLSGSSAESKGLRHKAEIKAIECSFDPDATYAGVNGKDHSERMKKVFHGYQAAGYSKEQIYEAMADQGMAIVNVGSGMCYGGKMEDFDDSLPCIGGLRCNPARCKNAVVTESHIPKWREVYVENMKVLERVSDGPLADQAREAVSEARMVLESLGAI